MFTSRRVVSEPERSARLRLIAFAAQVTGITALAYVTGLWIVWIVALVMLAVGHHAAYRYAEKPPLALHVGAIVLLHLVFAWMFVGLFSGQPYPQGQVAMLAMAVSQL